MTKMLVATSLLTDSTNQVCTPRALVALCIPSEPLAWRVIAVGQKTEQLPTFSALWVQTLVLMMGHY